MPTAFTLTELKKSGLSKQIYAQAEREYPAECCGLIVTREPGSWTHIPCQNQQHRLHTHNPQKFPRTGYTGYSIDPHVLLEYADALCCIYHSHPDQSPSFSTEDQRAAAPFGQPSYPGVSYLVIAVEHGRAHGDALYEWSPGHDRFIEATA